MTRAFQKITVLGAAMFAVLTACSTTVAGTATPAEQMEEQEPPPPKVPMDPAEEPRAAALQRARAIDPCGLLDVAAASKIVGEAPDSIMPGNELSDCTLYTHRDHILSWRFSVRLGSHGRLGQPEDVAGVKVVMPPPDPGNTTSCPSYVLLDQQQPPATVYLNVMAPSGSATPKTPCAAVKELITTTVARWQRPPLRADKVTQPAVPLGSVDPCAAVAAAKEGAQASPGEDTSACQSKPRGITVRLRFMSDPTRQLSSGARELTVGGIKMAQKTGVTGCEVSWAHNPREVSIIGDAGARTPDPKTQVVVVETPSCATSEAAVTGVLGALKPRKPPSSSRPDIPLQQLGDLDVPPTASTAGAPFDPCAVSWDAFPPEVRPISPVKPYAANIEPGDPYKVGCFFRLGPKSANPAFAPNVNGVFSTLIVWGTELKTVPDPAKGAVAKSYSGKPGTEAVGNDPKHGKQCTGIVKLANGAAGVSLTNSLVQIDPCVITTNILNTIAAQTP
ncbi:hypothetical protein EV193_1011009 [Herbihabitans rhizosphaerae]|uniref:DUF3558 domain-containing protein n=1 Tax=Herbihabitans rhizosphaerae TaxID=1872711 RepID=A0A4Q7L9K2_9PSEU|nr:hypothetical protein [Herbihabitans rhizosphaerae]RZS45122.1 hypothetical protein EV193_1011009 [Herbihabitans rhizosphaerae]